MIEPFDLRLLQAAARGATNDAERAALARVAELRRAGSTWPSAFSGAARAERDGLICSVVDRYYADGTRAKAARDLERDLLRYKTTRWRRGDDSCERCPYPAGSREAAMYGILVAGDGKILGFWRLFEIIGAGLGPTAGEKPNRNGEDDDGK